MAKTLFDAMIEVINEYHDLWIDDPENPTYRACCFIQVDSLGRVHDKHTPDCLAHKVVQKLKLLHMTEQTK